MTHKKLTGAALREVIRKSMVLVNGTRRIEQLHANRGIMSAESYQVALDAIIASVAAEYGPEFDEFGCREQLFDNAELPN